jgi:hypothetical protein
MKYEGEFKTKPLSAVNDSICISKEDWLTLLKPAIKENYRVEQDKKKRLRIDGFMDIRKTYEIK